MSEELLGRIPPDDTGSDVLKRYRYQAHVAFPFCLQCCLGDGIISVLMEHFEDVIIQYVDRWHFMQIKTRNPELDRWRLSDTLRTSGGLRSLARTYQVVKDFPGTFGLYLEGAIAKGDLLTFLVPPKKRGVNEELIQRISEGVELSLEECKDFIDRLIVKPILHHRDNISAMNIKMLGQIGSQIPHGEVVALYEGCIDELVRAMSGEPLRDELGDLVQEVEGSPREFKERIEAKRFTRERLSRILGPIIEGPYPLLQRVTDIQQPNPTNLELKLISGGANNDVVLDAKNLRANASIRIAEISSLNIFSPDKSFEDVRIRLKVLSNSVIQRFSDQDKPAKGAWHDLLQRLEGQSKHVDPNGIFRQDPYLLMGVVCELTDECEINWGVPIA
jgi:hypothetical protein